jgi:hypothetical protein
LVWGGSPGWSPEQELDLLDRGFSSVAPPGAIEAEILGLIVVSVLHREAGECTQWKQFAGLDTSLLQQQ